MIFDSVKYNQSHTVAIRKTFSCNEYPLKHHFDIVKLRFKFLIFDLNIDCGYSLEPPWRQNVRNIK